MSMQFKSDGVYADTRTGNFYHRPVIGGTRTWRKLKSTTLTAARKEVAVLKTRQLEADLGVAIDPYSDSVTIGNLAKAFADKKCPYRDGRDRSGERLDEEQARVDRLLPFWKTHDARKAITAEDCRDYRTWRVRNNKKPFRLDRSVDAELTTLANLLLWATHNPRKTGLRANPMPANRPRFDHHDNVRHCTAVMPMSDDVLHQVAVYLLGTDRSRPLGFQFLLEALTGARTSEIIACRTDAAAPGQPGYQDDHALHLNRKKKGIEPWALLEVIKGHSPLAELLRAFRAWHAVRYPHTPWFIPGHRFTGNKLEYHPIDRNSLTNALERACKELKLPQITSHGLRAYFVRTLRSLGVDDSEIAKRLGHRSGVGEVETTYGISEPGWFGSRKQDFLPGVMPPAWSKWLPPRSRSKKIVQPEPGYWEQIEEDDEDALKSAVYQPYTTTDQKERIKKHNSSAKKPTNPASLLVKSHTPHNSPPRRNHL